MATSDSLAKADPRQRSITRRRTLAIKCSKISSAALVLLLPVNMEPTAIRRSYILGKVASQVTSRRQGLHQQARTTLRRTANLLRPLRPVAVAATICQNRRIKLRLTHSVSQA